MIAYDVRVGLLAALLLQGSACASRAQAPSPDSLAAEPATAEGAPIEEPAATEENPLDEPATLALTVVATDADHYRIDVAVTAHETVDATLTVYGPEGVGVETTCALPALPAGGHYVCEANVGPVHTSTTITAALRWYDGDAVVAALTRSVALEGRREIPSPTGSVEQREGGLGTMELHSVESRPARTPDRAP